MWASPLKLKRVYLVFLHPVDQYDYIKAMKLKEKNKREMKQEKAERKRG